MNGPESVRPRGRGLDWERNAPLLAAHGWRALLLTVALALIAGLLYPASRTSIPEDPLLQSFECAAPPCFPQTPLSRLGDLLVRLPPLGYAAALLLCLPGLLLGARYLMNDRDGQAIPLLVAFFGTVVVLVGTDVIPHVLNPCPAFGPQLSGMCGEFAGRWDVQDRWHTLYHTLVGAAPLTALFGLLAGRLSVQAGQRTA
jgi:hypothetical protein